MKIGQRLIWGFVGIAMLTAVVGTVCVSQNMNTQRIAEEEVRMGISHLNDAWTLMEAQEHQEIAASSYLFLEVDLKEKRANYFYEKKRLEETYHKFYRKACAHTRALLEKYFENIEIFHSKIEKAFELHDQGADLEQIKKQLKETRKFAEIAHEEALEPIIKHVYKEHIESAEKSIAEGIYRTTATTVVISSIAVFLAIGLGLSVSRSISIPITRLKNATVKLSQGRLGTKADIQSNDEVGILADSFNKMSDELLRLVKLEKKLSAETAAAAVERERAEELQKAYQELKAAQDMLIQSEKLAVLGQLAAGVAHEINNPLFVISGRAEMMLKYKDKDKDTKNNSKIILEQSEKIRHIVARLLDFSHKRVFKLEPLDINGVVEKAISLLNYQVKTENVKLTKELDFNLPEILGDNSHLQEVFLNIMLNAVQAMEREGTLTVRTRKEKVTEYELRKTDRFKLGAELLVIEFEDTAEGMDEETLKKIFNPFFSTKEKGTGLGLSICYGIIEAHRGTIEVQSKLGKGSIFIVKLPM